MKRLILFASLITCSFLLKSQDPDGNYNPYVNGGMISPSPLLPLEVNGTGVISFNIGNTGSDPLEVFTDQYVTLTITLSYGEPDNADPLSAVGGTYAAFFIWSYSDGTYSAEQISTIPAGSSGTITIDYKVTQNSTSPGLNGFNVNIAPAPYQTTSNTQNDDAVSSYTYTELRDFGDAPVSYGSADHVLDFNNYLGSVWDGEPDYLASASADGDDLNGQDDEDGVVIPAEINRGETINISVSVKGNGWLNAWIDWNGDGDFGDAGERIASNVPRSDGTQNLAVTVPAGAIVSAPTFARFRFSPAAISSATGSANGGEVEDYQLSISCIPPVPTLTSSEETNIFCAGKSVTFTAGGGVYYEFRVNGSVAQSGLSATYTTSTLKDGDVVDVIVTDDLGCSAISEGITNIVNPLPIPVLNSSEEDNAFCAGTSVTFTAGGGTSYVFRIDGISVQSAISNTYITSSLKDGQGINVTVTDAYGCSATSDEIINTVFPLPDATLTSSDADNILCEGASVTFNAGGGINYEFRINEAIVQSGTSHTYTTSSLTDGQVVDVIVTDENGCTAISEGITNTVVENPTADAGPVLDAICQGGTTLPLGGSVGGSATGGIWSTPAGGSFIPDETSLSATWTPPPGYSGTATLTLTTTGGNCGSAFSSKMQVVNPSPVVVINDPAAVCSPETVDLTDPSVTEGSTTGLIYTYWMNAECTNPVETPAAAGDGTYYIMGTLSSTGCSSVSPVTVTVNPTPPAPVVAVTDNCNGTSFLSTEASGSLLWSTGETTSSITVNEAGIYTVTSTIDGCISDPGSGTAAPKNAPASPVVSDPTPVNVCPLETVDLTGLVTSSTPDGGSIHYKTTNDPGGTNVPDPTAVASGSYYIFYLSDEGCYSTSTEVTVTINTCPADITPTLIVNPNIMHGITTFNLTVRVTELNNVNTEGPIIVHIPKDSRWILTDGYLPSLAVLGTTNLDNIDWSYASDEINHVFTSSTSIQDGGYSTFGFRVTFDPGNTRGVYTITSQIVSGGGGEVRVNNNADSEKIDYFQE